MNHLKDDKQVYEAIQEELNRQRNKLEMIASENIVSYAVMEAQGSVLTNKYAEGYPGKRYYGGCEFVDKVEQLAIDRAKELFGAEHVNVQPHSGSQANFAVYYGLLKPGDTMMGMNLTDGGHLSHGSPVNISGNYFNVVPYGVRKEDELLDYEAMEKTAKEVRPKLIIGGTSAYSRIIDFERMAAIAHEVGALMTLTIVLRRPTSADLEVLCRISTESRNLLPPCSPLYWPHIIERNAGSFLWKELGEALRIGPNK